jgi:hypothetical protein
MARSIQCRPFALGTIAILLGLAGCNGSSEPESPLPVTKARTAVSPPPAASPIVPPPPTVPAGFVFRPAFETTKGNVKAGTAFAIELKGQDRPFLLSAMHLLGTAGGLREDIPAWEVPIAIKAVSIEDCFDPKHATPIGHDVLSLPDTTPLGRPSKIGDIVAIRIPAGVSVTPLRLASVMPADGERVWLAAQVAGGAPPSERLHAARSIGVSRDGDYFYEFENPDLVLRATSGAPILNAAGEVVAINLGGGKAPTRKLNGVGNPVTRFRPALDEAASKGAAP